MDDRIVLQPSDWENIDASTPSSALHSEYVMNKAKKRARGDLDDLSEFSMQLHALSTNPLLHVRGENIALHVDRGVIIENANTLTVKRFIELYEEPKIPCILTNTANFWPAFQKWTPKSLYSMHRHRKFRCGEDDNGKTVKVKLKHFLRYMKKQTDDSPLYIFDSMFDDSGTSCPIKQDYEIPKYFQEDLLHLVGENRRPPYRWFLLGPRRSGTTIHIDPLATSAWNTLIYGLKRWVLFPPDMSYKVVKAEDLVNKDELEDDESIDYFLKILPRLKEKHGLELTSRIIEFYQLPGETVFVPGGWWHAVLNVQDSCAVTQNYASSGNFNTVWLAVRDGRHGMARKWLQVLKRVRPDLACRADALNERDGWSESKAKLQHCKNKEKRLAQLLDHQKRHENEDEELSSGSSDSDDEEEVIELKRKKQNKSIKRKVKVTESSSEEESLPVCNLSM